MVNSGKNYDELKEILLFIIKQNPELLSDVISHHRTELSNSVAQHFDNVVGYGPFKGLRMPKQSSWGLRDKATMLMGIYEEEILRELASLGDPRRTFIDIGSAEGYYGIGVLVAGLFDKSYCLEMSEFSRNSIAANARVNGVEDRVIIRGAAIGSFYDQIAEEDLEGSVVLVDVEGAEFDIFDLQTFEAFATSTIIIELHDWFFDDGDQRLENLREAARSTHDSVEIKTGARDLRHIAELSAMNDDDRWLLCSEGRGRLMTWLRFDPKKKPLNSAERAQKPRLRQTKVSPPAMKAYHVYLFNGPYPSTAETEPRPFELITHIYSCLNHGNVNPDVPLCLVTDERTKRYYDELNITALYDEVITDLHDDYPRDRIAPAFWASPKIWAMSKLRAPFVIFDNDLVLHKPMSHLTDCDLLYLHRETSAIYPSVFDVTGPPGFVWDDALAWSFRNTQPMNCAVVGMFNDGFRADYAKRYFDFVLDATGEVLYATEGSRKMHPWSSAQIVAEQWLLAAVADYWRYSKGVPIKTRAVCKAIWSSEYFFPYDMDLGSDAAGAEVESSFYHLWGAKAVQNKRDNEKYEAVRDVLVSGRHIVERNPRFSAVDELFEKLMSELLG